MPFRCGCALKVGCSRPWWNSRNSEPAQARPFSIAKHAGVSAVWDRFRQQICLTRSRKEREEREEKLVMAFQKNSASPQFGVSARNSVCFALSAFSIEIRPKLQMHRNMPFLHPSGAEQLPSPTARIPSRTTPGDSPFPPARSALRSSAASDRSGTNQRYIRSA